MELMEAIRLRTSIRDYQDKPVPEEKLRKVLEATRWAPSASNRQRQKLIVVRDPERRKALWEASGHQRHVGEAPVVIVAVTTMPDYMMRCGVLAYPIDLAIALDHLTLAAAEEGLGTCWIGAYSQEEARRAVGIPEHGEYKIVVLMTLGFPAAAGRPKVRKPLSELVCYDSFQE